MKRPGICRPAWGQHCSTAALGNAVVAMGLPQSLVSAQLCLPLREWGFDINATGVHPTLPMELVHTNAC